MLLKRINALNYDSVRILFGEFHIGKQFWYHSDGLCGLVGRRVGVKFR